MIDSAVLLGAMQRELAVLLADLRDRVASEPVVGDPVRAEYDEAFAAGRTAWTFTQWAEERLTQVAVGWLLACVFVRFCEDNGLIDDVMLAADGPRAAEAQAAQRDYFSDHPHDSDREYLQEVFRRAAALPGLRGVLGEDHSPLWLVDPSADACSALLQGFRATDEDGRLRLGFADSSLDTRFLGDLYQDVSEYAKQNYALLQTPVFVEEFILDRTLEPAIEAHGLTATSLIDPTCGSGHFLLGAFERLWDRWHAACPGDPAPVVAQRALDAVWGVDLNPFAAAIARFRLLVAALRRCRIGRLLDAPNFSVRVAVGDSLLWGVPESRIPGMEAAGLGAAQHLYATEDADALRETFDRRYAAVVGNPPYIIPNDPAANDAYRTGYGSCYRQYSLAVPFTELFFALARPRNHATGAPAGFVGMITANSFMKRQFGKKLVEEYVPRWDLTHVVDTSGAYIPGHGTPTVILFGRNQLPVAPTIRTVLGVRGEPATPADPALGRVWTAIVDQIDRPGSESDFISVADTDRARFASHPWSIGGGGAAELKERLDLHPLRLSGLAESVGITCFTLEDSVYTVSGSVVQRQAFSSVRRIVEGEGVRDFSIAPGRFVLFPYDAGFSPTPPLGSMFAYMWMFRTCLANSRMFGAQTKTEAGLQWFEFGRLTSDKLRTPLSITFANVATTNHFVLDRGGKVFKQTAPVIKLPASASLDDHLGLLAVLNSSVACFWLQQVLHNKGAGGGASRNEKWRDFFAVDSKKVERIPLPSEALPVAAGRRLDDLATELASVQPSAVAGVPTRAVCDANRERADALFAEMVAAQEELDWLCLHRYGLVGAEAVAPEGADVPPLRLGERAFEIVLARRVAAGTEETEWFAHHGSTPTLDLPAPWPEWYRELVERRIALIETDRDVDLVERPECKRRWMRRPWDSLEAEARYEWLLTRLEDRTLWFEGDRAVVRSVAWLADRVAADPEWMEVARLWVGQVEIDPVAVVADLVADEHVPAQAAARYKAAGLAKRAEWERTWERQRAEDRGEDVGRIPVPPKYTAADFLRPSYWKQRGKLDVPKERFVSVVGAERDASSGDPTLVLAWAGFDHAETAQALATLLVQRQNEAGWAGERLLPLVAALDEIVHWVDQWHPEVDSGLGQPLGPFYRSLVDRTLAAIGATRVTLADWRPATPTRGRRRAAPAAPEPEV